MTASQAIVVQCITHKGMFDADVLYVCNRAWLAKGL